jgi:hypothetical protein
MSQEQLPTTDKPAQPRLGFMSELFPFQKDIIYDPARLKCLCFGRRSGKTYILKADAVRISEENPGVICCFVGLTKGHAKDLIWKELKIFDKNYSLGLHFNERDLTATFPNDSAIHLCGVAKEQDIEILRGLKPKMVAFDEAQSERIGNLEYIIEEIVMPTLSDYEGTLYLSGTPNYSCTGYFHKIWNNKDNFKKWHSTILQNPKFPAWSDLRMIPKWITKRMKDEQVNIKSKPAKQKWLRENWEVLAPEWLEREMTTYGISMTSSRFKREWLAEWTRTRDSHIIIFNDDLNTFEKLPDNKYNYVLGADFGTKDPVALVICAYANDDPNFYVIDVFQQAGMAFQQVMAKVKELDNIYAFESIQADPGGGGAQYVQDIEAQYGLPIEAAYKRDKPEHIELLSSEFQAGRIKIHKSLANYIDEIRRLRWLTAERKKITGGPDHFFDALRYAHVSTLGIRERQERKVPGFFQRYWEKRQQGPRTPEDKYIADLFQTDSAFSLEAE